MNIVITGGGGFLGSHLCDYLLEKGHFVICVDNLITGNIDNIAHLNNNKNFKFINHNVSNYIFLSEDVDAVSEEAEETPSELGSEDTVDDEPAEEAVSVEAEAEEPTQEPEDVKAPINPVDEVIAAAQAASSAAAAPRALRPARPITGLCVNHNFLPVCSSTARIMPG